MSGENQLPRGVTLPLRGPLPSPPGLTLLSTPLLISYGGLWPRLSAVGGGEIKAAPREPHQLPRSSSKPQCPGCCHCRPQPGFPGRSPLWPPQFLIFAGLAPSGTPTSCFKADVDRNAEAGSPLSSAAAPPRAQWLRPPPWLLPISRCPSKRGLGRAEARSLPASQGTWPALPSSPWSRAGTSATSPVAPWRQKPPGRWPRPPKPGPGRSASKGQQGEEGLGPQGGQCEGEAFCSYGSRGGGEGVPSSPAEPSGSQHHL